MRIVFALLLFILAVLSPWYVFLGAATLYAFRYFALELLGVALIVDVYFGVSMFPKYTLAVLAIVFLLEWYKTYSSFYNS